MERQAKDGTVYKQVGSDEWTPVTRTAKDGTVYKKMGEDAWTPLEVPSNQDPQKVSTTVSAVRKGIQGATGGFLDEASGVVEAAGRVFGKQGLGGSFDDVKDDPNGPTLDWDELKKAYEEGVRRKREYLAKDSKDNPKTSVVAEIAGGFASPLNKVTKGMSAVKGGLTTGAVYGLGNSEADSLGGLAFDTTVGAVGGAVIGKGAEKVAPYIEKGLQGSQVAVQKAKEKLGNYTKGKAEEWGFKTTGAMLKDWRNADDRGEVNKIGRWVLDKGLKAGSTVDDVAVLAEAERGKAALILDDIYAKSGNALKGSGKGFDPIRDKQRIMQAAEKELGDSVGGEAVLKQLSNYIDDLALKYGDAPNDVLKAKYQKDVAKYKNEYKTYLKEKKEYKKAFGDAADEQQQMLASFNDDSQRSATKLRQVELQGNDPAVMRPESYDFETQMDLFALPQAPTGMFNPARGADDLLPLSQKMAMNTRTNQIMLNEGKQAQAIGTELTPRTVVNAPYRGVIETGDQLSMRFQPTAPNRPQKPDVVRNPMSPRRANEIKGAFDEQINYSRNPLTNEPNKEKVFSGARRELNDVILESIDSIDDKVLGDALRRANTDYGTSSKISRIAGDRAQREKANKFFGLTDNITGVGGVAVSLMTGTPLTGLAMIGVKKAADKYGASTTAVALDALSKRLLKNPNLQQLAKVNPQQFNATVISLFESLESRGQLRFPKAAQNEKPTKGPDKWANDGIEMIQRSGANLDRKVLEKLKETPNGKKLLIEASSAKNEKAMAKVLEKIRTATKQENE